MKKLLAILLALALCVAALLSLSACGGDESSDCSDENSENINTETGGNNDEENAPGDDEGDENVAHTHTPGSAVMENKIPSTCTEDGSYEEVFYCTGCDYEISRALRTLRAGHDYSNYICIRCGDEIVPSEGLSFVSNGDGTCYVSGIGECKDLEIVIPSHSPRGDVVTGVGDNAFNNNQRIKNVYIPNSVKFIGESAFIGCYGLTEIIIPKGVEIIKHYAFLGCSFENVIISDSVTCIEDCAFSSCESLVNIEVDENNAFYRSTDGDLYTKDGKVLLQYAIGKSNDTFSIPFTVTEIRTNAFSYCSTLKKVKIPDNVTEIGVAAFSMCCSIESVEIGKGTMNIGEGAFAGCLALGEIDVSEDNRYYKTIDGDLYSKDEKLLLQYALGKEKRAFYIREGVTRIGAFAFGGEKELEFVYIADSLEEIGARAFTGCESLSHVVIKSGVKVIQNAAFDCCDSLASVYYEGTSEEWSNLTIIFDTTTNEDHYYGGNSYLTSATRYYYSEAEPTEEGNFWHYDAEGNVVVWEK